MTTPTEPDPKSVEALIAALVEETGGGDNADLIEEIIVTAAKLHRDRADRGEVKLINTALKEIRYSNLVFGKYPDNPRVTIFGSARTEPDEADYLLAERFAREMTLNREWMVVTGAGPGIMEAGSKGAGLDGSFGVNIRLPFEGAANEFIAPERVINFKYFFTRKLGFVKESHGFALLPGGFGTMDETFELLTLVQTGKSDLNPIVMLQADDPGYWDGWLDFVGKELLQRGMISAQDLSLFRLTADPVEAADYICHFYANYHSQRYVDGTLVLRLNKAPSDDVLERLNKDYADILTNGSIEKVNATPAEIADGDALDCERLALSFNRRDIGRLKTMVDELNDLVADPPRILHPASRFTP